MEQTPILYNFKSITPGLNAPIFGFRRGIIHFCLKCRVLSLNIGSNPETYGTLSELKIELLKRFTVLKLEGTVPFWVKSLFNFLAE